MAKKKRKNKFNIGYLFLGMQAIASLIFIVLLIQLNMLPTSILIMVGVVLALLFFLELARFLTKKKKKHTVTTIVSAILSILLLMGNFYVYRTNQALNKILGLDYQTHSVLVYVMDDSAYQVLEDLAGKKVGYVSQFDKENTDQAIVEMNKKLATEADLVDFASFQELTDALYDGTIDAMVMNEAFTAITSEYKETFQEDTRVIFAAEIDEVVQIDNKQVDVTKDTFTVYISGIDTYGPVSTVSRSDVNILMTINPKTHQILLTNIPRDYYVTLHSFGALDKLTHAGIYGVNESMATLEDLIGVDIDYYLRVNFSSVVDIVNALGGITVNNPHAFLDFPTGDIYLNGEEALKFSRDRYSFSSGDRERGRNQQRVIVGIIDKVLSPTIISNYTNILDAVAGSFQTNLTNSEVSSLVKMQLSNGGGWDIQSCSLDGAGASMVTYSYGSQPLYVMVPDETTVNRANQYITAMENGETISVE